MLSYIHLHSFPTRRSSDLTHAKIFTMAGAPIDDGTLIIKDGKIAAIGEGIPVPTEAKVIDGKGLQVYPGLFDSITQMGLRDRKSTRLNSSHVKISYAVFCL